MRNRIRADKKLFLCGIPVICLVFLLWINGNSSHDKISVGSLIAKEVANEALNRILPLFYYMGNEKGRIEYAWQEEISELLPFLCLEKGSGVSTMLREDVISLQEINVERISMEKLLMDNDEDILQEMERENQMIVKEMEAEMSGKALKKQFSISLESLSEYTELLKAFYTIDAAAQIDEDKLNAFVLGEMDLTIEKNQKEPQILIYHTHSQEGFIDSIPGDDSTTIMGVGEHLATILREDYGYQVLHHDGKYDVESRDSAYARSLPEIEQLLKDNPSIEVVIDLHRDAVADLNKKYVMDWQEKPTARFMYFNGVSRTRKNGEISYLYNENLEANLAFSFQMKRRAEEYYPGLTRKNYIHAYRYNMHLLPRYTLLELGAQNNTLEEAMNACEPIAHILDMVLSGEES